MGGQPSLPKNWPADSLLYLTSPSYSRLLSKPQLQSLRARPQDDPDLREIPPTLKPGPAPHVKITPITDPSHPAHGQAGLFAARPLPPGTLILPYLGEVHPSSSSSSGSGPEQDGQSDYDLWVDHAADLAVDAARMGNEARFVNDYRGVPGHARPNAEFRAVWDVRRAEKGMAVFVLPAGKAAARTGKAVGIAKGEEILVSYGKGFWEKSREEAEMGKVCEGLGGCVETV